MHETNCVQDAKEKRKEEQMSQTCFDRAYQTVAIKTTHTASGFFRQK